MSKLALTLDKHLPRAAAIADVDMKSRDTTQGFFPQPRVDLHCVRMVGLAAQALEEDRAD